MAKRTRVISPKVPEPPPQRWSNCLRVGDMVFVSGMVARVGDRIEGADEYEQARLIFGKIRDLVEAAGGKVDDVVKVTIYVVNIRNNTKVWKARAEVFSGDFPVKAKINGRVTLSALAPPNGYKISGQGDGGVAGFAKGGATVSLSDHEGGTLLKYDVEAQIGGKLAQLGQRLINGAAKKMADDFFARFAEAVKAG